MEPRGEIKYRSQPIVDSISDSISLELHYLLIQLRPIQFRTHSHLVAAPILWRPYFRHTVCASRPLPCSLLQLSNTATARSSRRHARSTPASVIPGRWAPGGLT